MTLIFVPAKRDRHAKMRLSGNTEFAFCLSFALRPTHSVFLAQFVRIDEQETNNPLVTSKECVDGIRTSFFRT